MKKTLNTDAIANELGSASPFFRDAHAKRDHQNQNAERTPERVNVRTGERVNARTGERKNVRTPEREVKRFSYNFYKDQVDRIDWLFLKKKMMGDTSFSRSDLVREAIDTHLKKLKAKGEFEDYPNG